MNKKWLLVRHKSFYFGLVKLNLLALSLGFTSTLDKLFNRMKFLAIIFLIFLKNTSEQGGTLGFVANIANSGFRKDLRDIFTSIS